MLDRLIKISSISGAFLIFCGVLKLIIYYSAFNITIVDFLSFSEIITSFLDDINILLIFVAIMLLVSLMTIKAIHKQTQLTTEDVFTTMLNTIYPFRYRFVLFFSIIIASLSTLLFFDIVGFNYFVVYFIIFSTIQLLTYLLMTKDEKNEIDIPIFAIAISTAFTITVAIFLLAKHDIQVAESNKHPVNIYTDNITIECNKKTKNIYLGKTDSYAFIKIDTSNSCISIPVSEIKKIEFK